MSAPPRVTATPEARQLLDEIISRHGEVLIHQSGGCCDGSSPMCFPRGEFRIGQGDVLLGELGDTPVYIGGLQFAAWKHTQLLLDAVAGRGGMFSLDNGTERRFLVRSRIFSQEELDALDAADQAREAPSHESGD